MNKQQGFTLIELVMVIVILGILAATALPKFANLQGDARIASINAASGAMKSAMAIVHAQAIIDSIEIDPDSSVALEGTTIEIAYGYPKATHIATAAGISTSDYTVNNGTIELRNNCSVVYTQAADANTAATVADPTISGC
jgi:MSHA pilin protein MshA